MPPPSPSPLVAALQLSATPDRGANLRRALALTEQAAAAGATLIATPENTDAIAPATERLAAAESLDGPLVTRWREQAQQLGVWILLGSFGERVAGEARVHNTSVLIDAQGELAAVYRKIHLFDATLPDAPPYRESEHVIPGRDTVVAPSTVGTLGLSICYDLRFPELYRLLASQGADVLAVPSAFTVPTGQAHWEVLLRARAIENLCFVVAPAQVGTHFLGRQSFGHSLIIDPWGTVLARADGREEGYIIARLDREAQQLARTHLPALDHRRL